MGMFDYVNITEDIKCVNSVCGKTLKGSSGFQSKDADCMMEVIDSRRLSNFYGNCETCASWNEISREMRPTFNTNLDTPTEQFLANIDTIRDLLMDVVRLIDEIGE